MIAENHSLCLTYRNLRSVVMAAISIGPPQVCAWLEDFIVFIVAKMHEWIKSIASLIGIIGCDNASGDINAFRSSIVPLQ